MVVFYGMQKSFHEICTFDAIAKSGDIIPALHWLTFGYTSCIRVWRYVELFDGANLLYLLNIGQIAS